ncbi:MAG: hypothetical protein IK125_06615 [Lachnospiraceae bacterium]|nr:hypothetical protein [Lachnospiraceae bacterium]
MLDFKRIVFICMDNTSGSIMAESIFNSIMDQLDPEQRIGACSRGLVVLFPEPLNPAVTQVLEENRLEVSKEYSEEITARDVAGGNTLLLCMTDREKKMTKERFPTALNLYTLSEFAGEQGELRMPFGKDLEAYGETFERMDMLVKLTVQRLQSAARKQNDTENIFGKTEGKAEINNDSIRL